MSTIKFNPGTVKLGKEIAGEIKEKVDAGSKHVDLSEAKTILSGLQRMKGANPGQKASVTKALHTLTDAIKYGEARNLATDLTDIRTPPGGGTGKPPGAR